jgi:hypothetical protein
VICSCHARIAYKDNTTYNPKYYITRKAVSIIIIICLAPYIMEREIGNSLKIKRDKVNKISTSFIHYYREDHL